VREGDTVARPVGDEFFITLKDLREDLLEAAQQAEGIGSKILTTLSEPYLLDGHAYRSTPSIGITLFQNWQSTVEELLKQADIAMHQAKKVGRKTMRFFDPKMQEAITARVGIEEELRLALARDEFCLYYQPQVDDANRVIGAEALIRWVHPTRGVVPPVQFIPLAEENDMILPIGQWVLQTACAQIAQWAKTPRTRDLMLSVNVSAKQFHQADFVASVRTAVDQAGIDPTRIKLELTEGMLLQSVEETIACMNALNRIGIQFSLDDFGTGYSSLQYLKRLPLDQIKIDQSFVRDIATDSSDQAIVRTIIAMAKSLELDVIAEGVETQEQRKLLLHKGCQQFQGYLFGRPVPVEQFDKTLVAGC
jgi:EAL domain-containing protein (putative c-di-GMP-specific phosphodiesterase class I)